MILSLVLTAVAAVIAGIVIATAPPRRSAQVAIAAYVAVTAYALYTHDWFMIGTCLVAGAAMAGVGLYVHHRAKATA